ncbi:uncharacterized protein LOC114214617 [Eumetopias jubatus]|uniref:uncharacterized protein LOC114214617 n=1 Tax=Eumetopias jubatus TaxID=34886 RepID=UPI001016DCBC|nr:uncharacterized protein LOC114214617 [Eumetopias jubatus]
MSHTPILVFCLGSRPLFPLGGGNVAALQHEGRVGSVRPGGPLGPKEGVAEHLWAATAPLRGPRGVERQRRGGRQGGLDCQRDSLHCSCCAEAARKVARGPWHEPRRQWLGSLARGAGTGRGAGSGRVGTPGHLAGVPAPRAEIWLCRPVRTERGTTPGGSGVSARRKLVPERLGSWLLLSTPAAFFQGRPREGRISGTAATAPSGRGGGGGRLARRLGERPGGPGLGPPQPPPLAAGGTRSGCAR